ncbi:MAG: hypothetical protein ACOCT0_05860, partial [Halobacteriota archaeon]
NLHPAAYDRAEIVVEGDEEDDSGGVSMPKPPEEESREDVVGLSERDGRSVAAFDDLSLAVSFPGDVEGDVSARAIEADDLPGSQVAVFEIEVDADVDRGDLEYEYSGDVSPHHLHVAKRDGGWRLLDTSVVDEDTPTVRANTSFSEFAVLASTEPVVEVERGERDGEVLLNASGSYDVYGAIDSITWDVGGETREGETVSVDDSVDDVNVNVTNDAGLESTESVELRDEEETEEDSSGEDEGGDEDEGLPGMGFAVGALALCLGAGVARRRRA